MAIRPSVKRIELSGDREGVARICTPHRLKLEKHLFQRYPKREWGTFFTFGWRRTAWGVGVFYIGGLWPVAGDLERQTALTTFTDQYILRAFKEAEKNSPKGLGVIHSHPAGFGTSPSPLDDDMDTYFAKEFALRTNGAPYCSLIFQRSDKSGLTFSGRIYERGEWIPLTTLFSVGEFPERHRSEIVEVASRADESFVTTEGLESLLGTPSALRLRESVVGIIGCSGSGSPAAHVLSRAKVGGFILADPQRASASNMERLHGFYHSHLKAAELLYKVELVRDLILETNPAAHVTGFAGNLLHDNVLDELIRCDAVLGCTDTVHGRLAASDLSHHYLLPILDVGVSMNGRDGKVSEQVIDFTLYRPDLPCALCGRSLDMAELAYELMPEAEREMRKRQALDALKRGDDPNQYWRHGERQLHTVGYLTTAAGSLAAGYLEGMLTGTFSIPHTTMQFDIGKARLAAIAPPREKVPACTCGQFVGWGDAGRAYRNVALPEHFGRRATLLFRKQST